MFTPVTQLIAQINPIGNPALAPNFQAMTNGFTYINTLLPTLITIGFIIGAVVFIFIFISGAFSWITAGGDKAKLEAARSRITHVIVGLVIMLLVYFIIQLVNYILGINIGMVGFPPPAPSPPTYPTSTPIPTPTLPPTAGSCINGNSSCACVCNSGYLPDPTSSCASVYPSCSGTCGCIPYNWPPQLLLNYKLDEGSGITVSDSSGNSYNSSLIDGPPGGGDSWVPGCSGSAVILDGYNEAFNRPAGTMGGKFYAPSFTLAAWVKPLPVGYWPSSPSRDAIIDNNSTGILSVDTPLDSNDYSVFSVKGIIYQFGPTSCGPESPFGTSVTSGRYSTTNWHHIAFTYDLNTRTGRLYVDGNPDGVNSNMDPPRYPPCIGGAGSCPVGIGENCYVGDHDDYKGVLDDVRIYNYALSSSDIAALASSCTPGGEGNVGDPCSGGGDCISGLCGRDNDGDTFPGSGPGTCLASGMAVDCNDNNNLVFPGQTQYFETPIAGSGINFDYDCSGVNEKWPRLDCLAAGPPAGLTCSSTPYADDEIRPYTGWRDFIPACGATLGTPYQPFFMCSAYTLLNNCSGMAIADEFGCFTSCRTGNRCGSGENQPCLSWAVDAWSPFSSYFADDFPPSGITRMPCK